MGYDPKKVIAVAEAEVGYLEKASTADLDDKTAHAGSGNFTKYARDLDAIKGFYNGRKQGVAWCDVFVDWCFVTAYGAEEGRALLCQPLKSAGAGCRHSRDYFKAKGRLFDTPQPGDQVFFWPSDRSDPSAVQHTGLVVVVDARYVYTIEGNTSSASGVVYNGGCVARKKYALDYARLAGFGRPDYGEVQPDAPLINAPLLWVGIVSTERDPLNIRAGGSLNAAVIGLAPRGARVEVLDILAPDGWVYGRCEGAQGYMSRQYLTPLEDMPAEPEGGDTPPGMWQVVNIFDSQAEAEAFAAEHGGTVHYNL